jgi:NAD(P)H-nitrite reductase large subunit
VTKLTLSRRTLTTDAKETHKWEKLLLATGSVPFVPPIPGLEAIDYLSFIGWDDAKRLSALVKNRKPRVLIVGAGLIGMKAAEALAGGLAQVTVVEKMERILPLALDDEASRMVSERFRTAGVELLNGTSVTGFTSVPGTKVKQATLEDGSTVEFDILIMAVGVRPRAELAQAAGIKVNRGIVADDHLRTSDKNVFAAGDVAEAPDVVFGDHRVNALWPNAALQGKYAGLNMAGANTPCPGSTSMNSVEFFGLPVLSAGLVNPPGNAGEYEVISRRDEDGYYRKAVLRDNVIVGMITTGEVDRAGILTSLIQERANVKRFKSALLDESFSHIYFPKAVRWDRIYEGKVGVDAQRR